MNTNRTTSLHLDRPVHCPAMLGIDEQPLKCGSMNVSSTEPSGLGFLDAARETFAELLQRTAATLGTRDVDIESLTIAKVAPRALAAVHALPAFTDPGLDPSVIGQRFKFLSQVVHRSDLLDETTRAFRQALTTLVNDVMTTIRRGIDSTLQQAPIAFPARRDALTKHLQAIDVQRPSLDAVTLLKHCLDRFDGFTKRRSLLPKSSFERVSAQFSHRLRAEYECGLKTVIDFVLAQLVQKARDSLRNHVERLAQAADRLQRHLQQLAVTLDERRRQASEQQKAVRTSAVLLLSGRSADEMIATMLARTQSADRTALADKLWKRMAEAAQAHLNERSTPLPDDAPLTAVLPAIPAEALADIFLALVVEAAGAEETIYPLLERHGLIAAARFLHHRAAPTERVGARAGHRFNIAFAQFSVVTLPPAQGPRDVEIRDRFVAELKEVAPNLHIAETGSQEQGVSLLRLEYGWPAGLMRTNGALLNAYAAAHDAEHPMHLLDISDSPDGMARPELLRLAKTLKGAKP